VGAHDLGSLRSGCARATSWRSPCCATTAAAELTTAGANRLAKAEFALAAVEGDVLGGLDDEQREALYGLLLQANSAHAVDCAAAVADC
jgi:hypothetical protein